MAALASPRTIWKSQPVRWVIAASAMIIVTIVGAVLILLWDLRNEQIAKTQRDVESLAMVLSEQIARGFQSVELLQTGAIEHIVRLGISTPADFKHRMSNLETHRRLGDQIRGLPHVDALVLTDTEGRLVNHSKYWPIPDVVNTDGPARAFHKNPDLNSFIDKPFRNPVSGEWAMPIARKITGSGGEFIGVVQGVTKLQYFEDYFRSVVRDQNYSVALFGSGAELITRFPRNDDMRGQSLAHRGIFKLLATSEQGTVRQESMSGRGELIISGRKLPQYPMSIVITQRLENALESWRYATIYVGGGALLIILLIGALALSIARKIVQNHKAQNLLLDAALNNMIQGVAMFDANARLIVCNDRFISMYDIPRARLKHGIQLNELLKMRTENGTFNPGSFSNPDEFVKHLMEEISAGNVVTVLQSLADGRHISINNKLMPDGCWVTTHEDITESRRREESFRLLFDQNPVPMWVYNRESFRFLAVNNAAIEHYGYSREQFMAMSTLDIRTKEGSERLQQSMRVGRVDHSMGETWRHIKADGTQIDVSVYARALDYEGHPARLVAAHDITDRQRAEEQQRRTQKFLDMIIENIPVPIMVKDAPGPSAGVADSRYTLINRACEELFGVSRDQIVGRSPRELYPQEQVDFIVAENMESLRSDDPVVVADHAVQTPGNGLRYAIAKTFAVRDENQKPQYLLTVLEDVTERRRWDQRVSRMAHYDALTDLPNRTTFYDALEVEIERAVKSGGELAVLSLDLDGFKDANDDYGHSVGDALLCEIARRLQEAVGAAFVARLGGDEFAVIVTGEVQPDGAESVAERLLQALGDEFVIEGCKISVGASIGAALFPKDGDDAKTLMLNADLALYRAKAETRGALIFFDAAMGERVRDRRAMQFDLASAIAKGELHLHYQPQKSMTGEPAGFEALLRWHCPKRGMVPPSEFIPVAEASGLIGTIGEWVTREACREAASWPVPLKIAVNISPMQFRDRNLAATVHSILLETGLAPARLELEVTEGVLIDDLSRAVSVLCRLKSLGLRIALDDFGTGYSSLSYLHAFAFDKIKIDRTFIGDLKTNKHSRAIVRAVIDLGRRLKVPILAEGVETEAQYAMLAKKGCDEVQGYLIGRPFPISEYADLVGRKPAVLPRAKAG